MTEPEIYWPACRFRPAARDRWQCAPGCGTVWNTFWTRGVCPGCSKRWTVTQCLECRHISPHEAWYHYPDDAESAEKTAGEREHAHT